MSSYAELEAVYGFVRDADNPYCFRYLNGGAYNDFLDDTHKEEYFDHGFIIAVLATADCGDWIFKCGVKAEGTSIAVDFSGTLGDSPLEDMGRFVYLVPVSGAYLGEDISVSRTETKCPARRCRKSLEIMHLCAGLKKIFYTNIQKTIAISGGVWYNNKEL